MDRILLVVAWVVLTVGVVLWSIKPRAQEPTSSPDEVPPGRLVDTQAEMMGRLSLGLAGMNPAIPAESQLAPLRDGSTADQISYAIFVGATATPEAGSEMLAEIVQADPDDPVVDMLAPLVFSTFDAAENGADLTEENSRILEERFGWYGRLAASMTDPQLLSEIEAASIRSAMVLLVFVLLFGMAGVLGFIGLILLIILSATGTIRFTIPDPARHGVYAETFSIWLLLMLVLQLIMMAIAPAGLGMILSTVAFFASLVALAWPVLRGKSWTQVRTDIGLVRPRWSDIPTGVASWTMALPFLGIGLAITLVLMFLHLALLGEAASPSHPAQQAAVGAGPLELIQLFILACIAAPIVEEIMFRGVFLSHLCGASRKWPVLLGLLFSVGLSSIVFAAIHPQGLIFIPPLAGLAIGFCISRLWLASLIPAMVAHGFSNGVVLSLSVLLFGS